MKDILNFLIKIGELKRMPRTGWVLRKIKNPETISGHTFRMAFMAWFLGEEKKLNLSKVIKIALIHDICEVYAGDITPYHPILPKDKRKWKKLTEKWPRFSQKEKQAFSHNKYKKEKRALEKLITKLPARLKSEIKNLWLDYEKGLTPEGRFIRQLDRVENLLQALEYWTKKKTFAIESWWAQVEELIDDPILIKFIKALENRFRQE